MAGSRPAGLEPVALYQGPRTGKRVSRINDPSQQVVEALPELRIVDDELWQAVKARQGR